MQIFRAIFSCNFLFSENEKKSLPFDYKYKHKYRVRLRFLWVHTRNLDVCDDFKSSLNAEMKKRQQQIAKIGLDRNGDQLIPFHNGQLLVVSAYKGSIALAATAISLTDIFLFLFYIIMRYEIHQIATYTTKINNNFFILSFFDEF